MRGSLLRAFAPYVALFLFLFLVFYAGVNYKDGFATRLNKFDVQLLVLGGAIFFCYAVGRLSSKTIVPVCVWALIFGFVLQPLIGTLWQNFSMFKLTAEIAVAIILFTNGLETPFKKIRHLFFPVASLSLAGVLVSTVAFSLILYVIASYFGISETSFLTSLVIISAILASTDPATISPVLNQLHFKKKALRQIATSDSALTDVSGSLVARVLLLVAVPVCIADRNSVFAYFVPLLGDRALITFIVQVVVGLAVGFLGYLALKRLYCSDLKEKEPEDPALLLSAPILIYVIANIAGGAGFLAVFIAGLLLDLFGNLRESYKFYDKLLDHLVKPFVFVVLGLIVPVNTLIYLAPIGILSAAIFLFFVRPAVTLISLMPWVSSGKLSWRETFFLSLTREAGVVAAILLIIVSNYEIVSSSYALAVGVWIIFISLLVEMPLVPMLARRIGVLLPEKSNS